jgi:hypothetical protein
MKVPSPGESIKEVEMDTILVVKNGGFILGTNEKHWLFISY